MRCIRCGHDSRRRERTSRRCPKCQGEFAFDPGAGDPLTDTAFQRAIDAVSAGGHLRWGVEHLYYEVCRRLQRGRRSNRRVLSITFLVGLALLIILAGVLIGVGAGNAAAGFILGAIGLAILAVLAPVVVPRARLLILSPPLVEKSAFDKLWQRWLKVHGEPKGRIVRPGQPPTTRRPLEPDIADYSFDRAVICDRARTVDLLLANNFHFENNCAVLSIDGYPPGPFETVRGMLKRNPRLHLYALHDASGPGCQLVHSLSNSPEWFAGQVPVTDVGLRPVHARARAFERLLTAPRPFSGVGEGLTRDESAWLSQHTLELAAIRPEQVLKRLFRAMNKRDGTDLVAGDGGNGGLVLFDSDSFGSDAADSDGGADGFG